MNLESAVERSRHDRYDVAGDPSLRALDFERRDNASGHGFNRHPSPNALPVPAGEVEIDLVPQAIQPHAVGPDRQLRGAQDLGFGELRARAERLHLSVAIELQPDAGRAPAVGEARS